MRYPPDHRQTHPNLKSWFSPTSSRMKAAHRGMTCEGSLPPSPHSSVVELLRASVLGREEMFAEEAMVLIVPREMWK
jgi:hypothetical protein